MRSIVLSIMAIIFISFTSKAQQDTLLNKDVVVVREYNPIISDANKINRLPNIEKQEEFAPVFQYSVFNKPMESVFNIVPISPASLGREPVKSYQQNYVSAGLGNYANIYGELFYNAFSSSDHNLSFLYKHRSSWGDVTLPNDQKVDAPYNSNEAILSYDRFYDYSFLSANFSFKDYTYRYYGYQTIDSTAVPYVQQWAAPTVIAYDKIHNRTKAGYTNYNVNFTYGTLASNYDELAYRVHVNYDNFSTRFKLFENNVALSGFLSKPIDNKAFGAKIDGEYRFYSLPSDTFRLWNQQNFLDLAITPFFELNGETWNLNLGAGIHMYSVKDKFTTLVVPDIRFNFNIIEKYFTSYILLNGDYQSNNYSEILSKNPFVSPNLLVEPTEIPFNAELGLKGFLTPKMVFNASVGFSVITNQYFFINEFYNDPADVNTYFHSNLFRVEYDDMNKLSIKSSIDYSGNDKFDFGIKGAYYNYSLETLENPTNMPEYTIGLYGTYKPVNNVRVKGAFNTIGKRYALTKPGVNSDYGTLNAVYDISLSGEYDYTKQLSGFIKINNIIGSKYDYWYGYPSQRFNVLVGATYRF